jgi:hypothetical protein
MVIEFKRSVYELALTELSRYLPPPPALRRPAGAGLRGAHRPAGGADGWFTSPHSPASEMKDQ